MSPISNDKLLKLITALSNKVDSLSDIIKIQTNLIEDLNTDSIKLNTLINKEFKQNNERLLVLPIKQIAKSLIKLDNDNDNTLILNNFNENDTVDYTNKSNLVDFFNNKLNIKNKLITHINKYIKPNKTDFSNNNNNKKPIAKYFIKFDNRDILLDILKNKQELVGTNYYINIKYSLETDNILYNTRKLVKSNSIVKTWVYKDKVYINIDSDKNTNIHISDLSQLNKL